MRYKIEDLTGKRFGRLVVTSRADKDKHSHPTWSVMCDCGVSTVAQSGSLRYGTKKSCGCLHAEAVRTNRLTHGHARRGKHNPIFDIWNGIKQRCNNPRNNRYAEYGGRGITICDRWSDFMNFLNDMGERPKGFSVDRINVNGNYEPTNCRWADQKTQRNNQRAKAIEKFTTEELLAELEKRQ